MNGTLARLDAAERQVRGTGRQPAFGKESRKSACGSATRKPHPGPSMRGQCASLENSRTEFARLKSLTEPTFPIPKGLVETGHAFTPRNIGDSLPRPACTVPGAGNRKADLSTYLWTSHESVCSIDQERCRDMVSGRFGEASCYGRQLGECPLDIVECNGV